MYEICGERGSMINKLWFLIQNDEIVGAYDDKDIAIEERIYLKEENPLDRVTMHALGIAELSDYPDEYDYAKERGFLDELN
jgi:hypothetical protein